MWVALLFLPQSRNADMCAVGLALFKHRSARVHRGTILVDVRTPLRSNHPNHLENDANQTIYV